MPVDLVSLPSDVIILVMQYLSARDLAALCCTCRTLHSLVEEFGWSGYLRVNPRPSYSLAKSFASWALGAQVQYNTITDRNWTRPHFVARPLSQRWIGKLQPLLTINPSRLLLGAGNSIFSYGFSSSPGADVSPPVRLECTYTTGAFHPNRDITALTSVPDGGLNRTVFVGYADGNFERVTLPPCEELAKTSGYIDASLRERYSFHDESLVEDLSASGSHLLSLSASGTAALLPLAPESAEPELINLHTRSWSCHLRMDASTPYAVFGTASFTPLSVHTIHESHISRQPSVYLASSSKTERPTAVYAITSAPPTCAWGASDQLIVSGWYDGFVRVFDLRSPTRTYGTATQPSHLPAMTFCDPWSPEPIYSLSCGGGAAAHIAAGSARHSVVAFWDIRFPVKDWSVHAPGNDSSPLYSVIMDGARVFGANESRGFVYDFGPGVTESTYPPIPEESVPNMRRGGRWRRAADEQVVKPKMEGPGFYVTKYKHNKY